MPYSATQIDRLYVLRWDTTPTVADIADLERDVRAAEKAAKRSILYVSIVPPNLDVPSSEARDAFNRVLPQLAGLSDVIAMVIEGTSVRAILIRSLVRGMAFATRGRPATTIHATIQEALEKLEKKFGVNAAVAMRELRARNIAT